MSYRMRQKEIAFPVTRLVALVAVGLAFVPKLPLVAGVCVVLAIVFILGLLLYPLHTRTEKRGATKAYSFGVAPCKRSLRKEPAGVGGI